MDVTGNGRQGAGAGKTVGVGVAHGSVEGLGARREPARVAADPRLEVTPDPEFALVDRFERLELDLVLVDDFT